MRFETESGCAQLAMKTEHGYIAASDQREEGYLVGMQSNFRVAFQRCG